MHLAVEYSWLYAQLFILVCMCARDVCMYKEITWEHACFKPSCSVCSCEPLHKCVCVLRLRHIKRALSHQSDILRRQHLCVCEYGLWLQLVKHVSITIENSDVLAPCKSGFIGPAAQTDYRKLPCQELISSLGFFRPPLLLGSSSARDLVTRIVECTY